MTAVSATRVLARALPRASLIVPASRSAATQCSRGAQMFQQTCRRQYSSRPTPPNSRNALYLGGITTTIVLFALGYNTTQTKNDTPQFHLKKGSAGETPGLIKPTQKDYQKVYNAIADLLWEKDDYDDGSYGPVVLRLAWHASGTYDKETNTGGSNGATMRFDTESEHGANNGLVNARNFLEPIKEQFPWISYSDLWTLAGVCAIQEMQGPRVPWRPGRVDRDESYCSPDGRLPDGSKGHRHLRGIFGRMGFDDKEIVALSGAHALGRCHTPRSGFEGPWTFSPTVVTNEYFRLLVEEDWHWREWNGNKQWQDKTSKSLMMLPTDMALIEDKEFKKYVVEYAKDEQVFFRDFSDVIVKLLELGVPFEKDTNRMEFVTLNDQE